MMIRFYKISQEQIDNQNADYPEYLYCVNDGDWVYTTDNDDCVYSQAWIYSHYCFIDDVDDEAFYKKIHDLLDLLNQQNRDEL